VVTCRSGPGRMNAKEFLAHLPTCASCMAGAFLSRIE
jgi:hypothetical protein